MKFCCFMPDVLFSAAPPRLGRIFRVLPRGIIANLLKQYFTFYNVFIAVFKQ